MVLQSTPALAQGQALRGFPEVARNLSECARYSLLINSQAQKLRATYPLPVCGTRQYSWLRAPRASRARLTPSTGEEIQHALPLQSTAVHRPSGAQRDFPPHRRGLYRRRRHRMLIPHLHRVRPLLRPCLARRLSGHAHQMMACHWISWVPR